MRDEILFEYENENRAVSDDGKSGQGCTVHIARERLTEAARTMLSEDYLLEDVTVSDFKEGFQAQYHFARWGNKGRITLRTHAPHADACFPSISHIYQGADWHEREAMDFYPVQFNGHPNPAPLLLPEDMETEFPLEKKEDKRKSFFEIVCCQKIIETDGEHLLCNCGMNLGYDELADEIRCAPDFRNETHPEAKRLEVEDGDFYTRNFEEGTEDRLILNMGPQHPSTHGVLRVVLELDGEYVMRAEPVLGYVHRMHEKMGEIKQWHQYLPNMGRVDYLHALAWNEAYCQAVEKLADMELPRRAQVIRVIASELNRITSHLLWWGAYLLDLGAFTPIMYGFEDRERIMDLLQKVTGSRLTYCYYRFGGVSHDFPNELIPETREILKILRDRLPMFKALVTDNVILRKRVEDIGIIDDSMCLRYGASGPVLRGSGVACDVRRSDPYSIYPELDFEVPAYGGQDAFARYLVRMDEIEQSIHIVEQALDMLPGCDDGHIMKKAPKPGFKPPTGEAYGCVEGGRGRIGVYVASDGTNTPYRVKLRAPSFCNLSLFSECASGVLLADAVSILGSLDLVIPEIDR